MIPRYRAWLKKDKEMINVDEIHFNNGELDYIGDAITWMCQNNDFVLMQSTGLFDKNGKEIFEGDILGTKDGLLNGVVEFNIDLGMWTNSLIRYNNFERLCSIANSREIIGNIWEDGELLDGENTEEN
nr:MAG TPA: YopX protein [Caudoviricetes sp.]